MHCFCAQAPSLCMLLSGVLCVRPGQVLSCHVVCLSHMQAPFTQLAQGSCVSGQDRSSLVILCACFSQAPFTQLAQGSCVCVCISSPCRPLHFACSGACSLCIHCSYTLSGVLAATSSWAHAADRCFGEDLLLLLTCHCVCACFSQPLSLRCLH